MSSRPSVFSVVGCHHQRMEEPLRERFALSNEQAAELALRFSQDALLAESILLNTCNRIEIYAVGPQAEVRARFEQLLSLACGQPHEVVAAVLYQHVQTEAIRHLFQVAAGLDSQIVGETEILGQVKAAYEAARQLGSAGRLTHKLFQKAFQCAKYVRTHTSIGIGHVSLGNVAVDLAQRIFGDLSASRLMVIGSGGVGQDVAHAFRNRGVLSIHISSRTEERAAALAATIGGVTVAMDQWDALLATVDIVIFATSAPGCILSQGQLANRLDARNGQPLFLIDLAVPRDVEESCASLEEVYLYAMQDLAAIANENLAARLEHIDQARDIIAQKVLALAPLLPG